jgi:hypothetical protein
MYDAKIIANIDLNKSTVVKIICHKGEKRSAVSDVLRKLRAILTCNEACIFLTKKAEDRGSKHTDYTMYFNCTFAPARKLWPK